MNESSGDNTQKFKCAVQTEIFLKNTLFDLPSSIVGSATPDTHVQLC